MMVLLSVEKENMVDWQQQFNKEVDGNSLVPTPSRSMHYKRLSCASHRKLYCQSNPPREVSLRLTALRDLRCARIQFKYF